MHNHENQVQQLHNFSSTARQHAPKTMIKEIPIRTFKTKSNNSYFRSLELLSVAEDDGRELGSIDAISRTARSLSCANTGRYWRPPKPLPAAKSLSSAASISTPFLSSAIALIKFSGSKSLQKERRWEKRGSDLRECRRKGNEFDSSQRRIESRRKAGICFSFYI